MSVRQPKPVLLAVSLLLLLLSSCAAPPPPRLSPENQLAYRVSGEGRLAAAAPVFVIEHPEHAYNRIGAPILVEREDGGGEVIVDPDLPRIFAVERSWQGSRGRYTNLIYRLHFSEVPFSLVPFHLTSGSNVGLLVILTVNEKDQPVLVTTLHTCGCYLAFVPTSYLDPAAFPSGWDPDGQWVFGERLPGLLQYGDGSAPTRLHILLRDSVHRVMALLLVEADSDSHLRIDQAELLQLDSLSHLQAADGQEFSFFETEGPRQGYVRGSSKIWERLLISWWALDWRVGEDKRLGRNAADGPVFYTSLKPWAREASDLRDFPKFLEYWGWDL